MGNQQLRRKSHSHTLLVILLLVAMHAMAPDSMQAQGKPGVRWQGRNYILVYPDTSAGGIIWEIDTVGIRTFLNMLVDSTLEVSPVGLTSDSACVIFTVGPRKLTESLINPGTANGQVLQTNSGVAGWVADPALPDKVSQFFYSTAIQCQVKSDTSNCILSISQLSKEYPIAHGSTYSAVSAHIYLRTTTLHRSYTTTMVTVGSGSTALAAGDKIILRFWPGNGVSTDKDLSLYRIPEGTNVVGSGSTVIYGENIGYFRIPAAYFPSSGYVNLDVTLAYKVK